MHDEKPDVCFFINDTIPKKGDQDETVRKFKETLQAADINNISHVMTLGQLKRDYNTHNLKLKLCHTYDVFFVESRIAEHVFSVLGKPFIKKRKRPFQIDTRNEKTMKFSIDSAFKKSIMKITPKSIISSFEIGIAKMDDDKIAENILSSIEQLNEKWPGGSNNVSRIYIRPMQPSKVSIPIYASAINPNDVRVPVIVGDKQKRLSKLEKKLKIKSEKLKIDLKSKKIVNTREFKKPPGAIDATKKRKLSEHDSQLATPKKSKKQQAAIEKATIANEEKVKKQMKSVEVTQTEVVTDKHDKKKKKKKEKKLEVIEEPQPEVAAETKVKEKKKKVKDVEPAVKENVKDKKKKKTAAVIEDSPSASIEEPIKPKNKKKSTAALTDAINSRDEKSTDGPAEKDHSAAKNKKKKAKKNKA